MISCPNCGRENADNFNFCLDCGYDLKAYRDSLTDAAPPVDGPIDAENLPDGAPTEPMSKDDVAASVPQGMVDLSGGAAPADVAQNAVPEGMVDLSNPDAVPQGMVDLSAGAAAPAVEPPPAAPAPAAPAAPPPAAPAPAAAEPAPAPEPAAAEAAPAAATINCPSCKSEMPENMKFCGACGFRLDQSAPEPPPPPGGGRTMFMHAADLTKSAEKVCKLVTIDQTGKEGMTYTLNAGETLCGRVNGVILFFDDPYVSPTHCLFNFKDDGLAVTDQGSLNGVYVRIKDNRELVDGDYLRIGRQLFRFEAMASGAEQITRAEEDDAKIWGSPNPGAFGRLLQILEDGRTGEIRLLTGDACNLGREQGEIVFPTDGFISGSHCQFYQGSSSVEVKDLGSSNGTYVRVRESAVVKHGDFLLVGNQMLRVEIG